MTCEHCLGADEIFDEKGARKNLKKYRRKGLTGASKHLFKGIQLHKNGASSILEIGGGIGGIHLELLKSGFERACDVDASSGYLKLAKEEAQKQGLHDKISYLFGDYMDHHKNIRKHDVVVLDKVVCCYPDFQDLLFHATTHATELIALSYPKSNVFGRMLVFMGNLFFRFKGSAFRAYMHPNAEIREIVHRSGFERIFYKSILPWNIEVYKKSANSLFDGVNKG